MGQTITQKIYARAASRGEVEVGEPVTCRPDHMVAYDFPGYTDMMFDQMKELGVDRVAEPDRYVLFIDHLLPTAVPKRGRDFAKDDEYHDITRRWAAEQGVALHERAGIGHQLAAELGYGLPGEMVVHFDGHITQLGAHGCIGLGVRRDLLAAWVSGELNLEVPASQRFELTGELGHGVLSRDLLHQIIGDIGADGSVGRVMEFYGPGATEMALDGRSALAGMAMFTGATSAIFEPDARSLAYASERASRPFEPLYSDPDSEFTETFQYDLGEVEPRVVIPPSPRNTRPLSEIEGTAIQQGYIGSCVSGRIEDLRAAAEVLAGQKVAEGVRLYAIPTSRQIMQQAEEEGLLDVIREAGGFIEEPSCDYCFGHAGTLEPDDVCISTGVLNIPGRMGSTRANIYMASAYTVAASAVVGAIADPRDLLERA